MAETASDSAATLVLAVLTALWLRGIWRQFVRPPKEADFDWAMTHGFHVIVGTIFLIGLWASLWKAAFRTAGLLQ